jgi:hypothetical protein
MTGQVRVYSQPTGKAKTLLISRRNGQESKITVGSELFWPRDSWLSEGTTDELWVSLGISVGTSNAP